MFPNIGFTCGCCGWPKVFVDPKAYRGSIQGSLASSNATLTSIRVGRGAKGRRLTKRAGGWLLLLIWLSPCRLEHGQQNKGM